VAINDRENANNGARLQAIAQRVSKQITLEAMFRTAKLAVLKYEIDIPASTVTAIKAEFGELRTEIGTLEAAIEPNES
jgi:hypothetical protein